MTSFGGQSVGVVTVSRPGSVGYLGLKLEQRATVSMTGCRMRLFSTTESPESDTDVASEVWKCTAPGSSAAALAVQPGDELSFDGKTFQVQGFPAPKFDMDGAVHHVTIMAKRQT